MAIALTLIVSVGCTLVADVPSPVSEVTLREWRDISYGPTSSAQRLDLYLPATGNGPFPLLYGYTAAVGNPGRRNFLRTRSSGASPRVALPSRVLDIV